MTSYSRANITELARECKRSGCKGFAAILAFLALARQTRMDLPGMTLGNGSDKETISDYFSHKPYFDPTKGQLIVQRDVETPAVIFDLVETAVLHYNEMPLAHRHFYNVRFGEIAEWYLKNLAGMNCQ